MLFRSDRAVTAGATVTRPLADMFYGDRAATLTDPFGHVWHVARELDLSAMQAGARAFIGQHDFTTFRAAECQAKSPVKTLDRFAVMARGDEIAFLASARSFLHHQVRSMVGTLKLVGEGKWRAGDVARALEAKDRTRCGPVAHIGPCSPRGTGPRFLGGGS